MQCQRQSITLGIAWTTHKITIGASGLQQAKCGPNDRADFLLFAKTQSAARGRVLAQIYHTTDVPEQTSSMRPGIVVPETRLLASANFILLLSWTMRCKHVGDLRKNGIILFEEEGQHV